MGEILSGSWYRLHRVSYSPLTSSSPIAMASHRRRPFNDHHYHSNHLPVPLKTYHFQAPKFPWMKCVLQIKFPWMKWILQIQWMYSNPCLQIRCELNSFLLTSHLMFCISRSLNSIFFLIFGNQETRILQVQKIWSYSL